MQNDKRLIIADPDNKTLRFDNMQLFYRVVELLDDLSDRLGCLVSEK